MGRERHPAPVVAALSATPGLVAEEPRLWRSCEGDGTLGARHLESRRARGVRSDLAREPSPALLRVEVKPMQLVTLPSPFVPPETVVATAVYTARAILHVKGGDVWRSPDPFRWGRDRKTSV